MNKTTIDKSLNKLFGTSEISRKFYLNSRTKI